MRQRNSVSPPEQGWSAWAFVSAWRLWLCLTACLLALWLGGPSLLRTPALESRLPLFNLACFILACLFAALTLLGLLDRKRKTPPGVSAGGADDLDAATETAYAARRARLDDEAPSGAAGVPREWSLELLHELDWKRFEDLCVAYYRARDINAYSTPMGAEGGVDIRLYQDEFDAERCTAIVQCKAWGERFVGPSVIRDLHDTMLKERIERGFFMVPGKFSHEACDLAAELGVTLIDGTLLLSMLKRLPSDVGGRLLHNICQGDWRTPSCPLCGVKMKLQGDEQGQIWACPNHSRCRQTASIRPLSLPE